MPSIYTSIYFKSHFIIGCDFSLTYIEHTITSHNEIQYVPANSNSTFFIFEEFHVLPVNCHVILYYILETNRTTDPANGLEDFATYVVLDKILSVLPLDDQIEREYVFYIKGYIDDGVFLYTP